MNIIENCDINITFLVNDKRGTEIVTENMFEHLLHFATQAAIQIFFFKPVTNIVLLSR